MTTLYRKYRPQDFNEVVGQNHIKLTLEHEIQSGKIAHAYLFCGPRAVGKTTLARVLAKAVNCTKRKEGAFEPCNKCESCQEITSGRSIDMIEIDAASHTGVDNVRENIIASARVSPVKSKYKVFVIDEVHMLSTSAFNALLKIIEEPPRHVIFILCTTEIHKVPTTIISRCQRFDFKKISMADMSRKLRYIVEKEGVSVDKEILDEVARQSEGHMRDAESMLGQIVSISGKEVTAEEASLVIPRSDLAEAINLIDTLNKKDAAGGIRLINKLVDEGVDLKIFTSDLIEILRKMILVKVNPGLAEKLGLELGENLEIKINEASKGIGLPGLTVYIEEFLQAKNELKNASIIQLPLELAVINLCTYESGYAEKIQKQSGNLTSQGKETIQPEKKPAGSPSILSSLNTGVNQDDIMSRWGEVLSKIKLENHSLSFVLKVCEPRGLKGNQLCLAFKYKFHKDRINDIKIKNMIEKALSEVYGATLTVEAIVDENIEISESVVDAPVKAPASGTVAPTEDKTGKNGDANMLDNLLKTFGGKVVG